MPSRADTGTVRPAPAGDQGLQPTATVVGFDGVVVGSVTRHRESSPDAVVVSVLGDLDADTGPLLHTALTEALRVNHRVCCDLTGATFFGADGANIVAAAHVRATSTGRHFTVRGAHGMTRRVLAMTGLDETLERTFP